MQKIHQVLDFLQGKKTILLAISTNVVGYIGALHWISPELTSLLLSILGILGGGAVYATYKAGQEGKLSSRKD